MENIKYHPILFSTPMVQALLDNRKKQTRRIIRLPNYHPSLPEKQISKMVIKDWILYDGNHENIGTIKAPYKVGDVLWVRETSYECISENLQGVFYYKATMLSSWSFKWKPSIFMPKKACRIFLKIKSIKVERLQDISEEDAKAEGVKFLPNGSYRNYHEEEIDQNYMYTKQAKISFETLWESINGFDSLASNPYVFVYEFEQIEKPLDFIV